MALILLAIMILQGDPVSFFTGGGVEKPIH